MTTAKTKTESPLMEWWRHHGDEINDADAHRVMHEHRQWERSEGQG